MSDKIETPCAGCRFARWYPTDNHYGECGHPAADQARSLPMVMQRPYVHSIARESMTREPGTCAAWECAR